MALGGSKQRALLALLLLHANRVVSRDRLIDELWDGSPPETASTALQVHVSQLRKALGRDAIVTQAPGYLVTVEPGALDSERFELLVEEAHGSDADDSRGKAAGGARALAWPAVCRPGRLPRAAGAGAARGATRLCARAADRRRPRAGPARRGRLRAGGARPRGSASGAPAGTADARSVPVRTSGRRARRVPQRQEAPRRRAWPRARRGAATAREGNPRAGPGACCARSSPAARSDVRRASPAEPLPGGGRDRRRCCSRARSLR